MVRRGTVWPRFALPQQHRSVVRPNQRDAVAVPGSRRRYPSGVAAHVPVRGVFPGDRRNGHSPGGPPSATTTRTVANPIVTGPSRPLAPEWPFLIACSLNVQQPPSRASPSPRSFDRPAGLRALRGRRAHPKRQPTRKQPRRTSGGVFCCTELGTRNPE